MSTERTQSPAIPLRRLSWPLQTPPRREELEWLDPALSEPSTGFEDPDADLPFNIVDALQRFEALTASPTHELTIEHIEVAEPEEFDEDSWLEELRGTPIERRYTTPAEERQRLAALRDPTGRMNRRLSIRERMSNMQVIPRHGGRFVVAGVTERLMAENVVRELQGAIVLFERQLWGECQAQCFDIIEADPSEAIMARAHMMLGVLPTEWTSLNEKLYHMRQSLRFWTVVIEGTGRSKFPIAKAVEQLVVVQGYMEALQAEVRAMAHRSFAASD